MSITWEILSYSGGTPGCISEDEQFIVRGLGTLAPGEHVTYPTDGSVHRLLVCETPTAGGNAAMSLKMSGRGAVMLDLVLPDGTVKPGLPWVQQKPLQGMWRGAANLYRPALNTFTNPLMSGLWQAHFWNPSTKLTRKVTILVTVYSDYGSERKLMMPPDDWNIQ